ncbi:hypothetical protein [Pseudothauera rhizosphaerae]|uniref:Uncharacterized protein n=1 Tax=Pseudothauera rhizosphaerae TaxID=2565932 RepID=A0A4V3WAT0_9RHOO|nr:hypothetical protein [Pseudothauera rhizosphaerae]THF60524.1 hypothetical protein E6O51_13720 [Pseudothauera rhizosphaerae]
MSTKPTEDWNDLTVEARDETPGLELPPARKPPQRLLLPVLLVLSLAALAGGWLSPFNPWPSGPSEADLAQGREAILRLADNAVRDYARRNGRYPARLDDAIVLPAGLQVEYVAHPSDFELRIADDDGLEAGPRPEPSQPRPR